MFIDCHYHLDEEMVPVPNLLQSMDRHNIDRVALIGTPYAPLQLNPIFETIAMGLFQRVIHNEKNPLITPVRKGYAGSVKPGGSVSIGGKKFNLFSQPDNRTVMRVCTDYPNRFYGWVVINPHGGADPIEEIERCMTLPNMIGVKAHPYWYHFPIAMLEDAAAWCQEQRKPMIIHLGTGIRGDFRLLPEKFPALRVIYCHAGVPYPNQVCEYARERPNVFVDISSSAFMNPKAVRKAIALAGIDKCLFGSDGPYHHIRNQLFDFGFYKIMVSASKLLPDDLEKFSQGIFSES